MKPILIMMAALLSLAALANAQGNGANGQGKGGPPESPPGKGPPESPPGKGEGQGNEMAEEARNQARDAAARELLEEQRKLYDAERKSLRDALKAEIEALGRGAKRDEVNAVVARFKEDNAALIEGQRLAAEALKEAAREVQEANRANVPDGVKNLRDLLAQSRLSKKQAQEAFKKAMQQAKTPEKRREILDEHVAEQRDHHRQVRDDLKKLREEIRNSLVDGDRRPEE